MKTLKDLAKKHYGEMHYSFDVYYYPVHNDNMYVGLLRNVLEIKGYEVKLSAKSIKKLVKKADVFLDGCYSAKVDRESMKQLVEQWNYDNSETLKIKKRKLPF